MSGVKIRTAITVCLLLPFLLVSNAPGQENHIDCPDYHWWYGCTPTSVGMILGWYDRNGYKGNDYGNLIPGGVAGFSTHTQNIIGEWVANGDTIASRAIASSGHVADFWGVDDYNGRDYDCIADFIRTSQYPQHNGSTDLDHLREGVGDYFRYRGYGGARVEHHEVDLYGGSFTYEDFKAEIDAGRPVLLSVHGEYHHSMVGYGYDYSGGVNRVMLHDTWAPGRHKMWWGGAYQTKGNLFQPSETAYLTDVWTILPDAAVLRTNPGHRDELDFGSMLLGQTAQRSITAENTGRWYADGTTNYLSFVWGDLPGGSGWSGDPPPPYVVLAPGEQTQRSFTYAPARRGESTAYVTMKSDVNDVLVKMTGRGVAPVAEVTTVGAGFVRIGTTGLAGVRIRNTGDGNLAAVDNPDLWLQSCLRGNAEKLDTGPFRGEGATFALEDDTSTGVCGLATCTYQFKPLQRGPGQSVVTCRFENGGNNQNLPHTVQAVLTGTGVGPEFACPWDPDAPVYLGAFLPGTSADLTMPIYNLSDDEDGGWTYLTDLSVLDVQFSGPDGALFAPPPQDPAVPILLHKGRQWLLELDFLAPDQPGRKRATVTLITDVGAFPQTPGATYSYDLALDVVPEPTTLALLPLAALALLPRRKKPLLR